MCFRDLNIRPPDPTDTQISALKLNEYFFLYSAPIHLKNAHGTGVMHPMYRILEVVPVEVRTRVARVLVTLRSDH
jgi:hypothetical protein